MLRLKYPDGRVNFTQYLKQDFIIYLCSINVPRLRSKYK